MKIYIKGVVAMQDKENGQKEKPTLEELHKAVYNSCSRISEETFDDDDADCCID